jgi:hypothetical protein
VCTFCGAFDESLHLVVSAFAVEKVSGFARAFSFAPLWLFAAANVRADFVATGKLLLG